MGINVFRMQITDYYMAGPHDDGKRTSENARECETNGRDEFPAASAVLHDVEECRPPNDPRVSSAVHCVHVWVVCSFVCLCSLPVLPCSLCFGIGYKILRKITRWIVLLWIEV